MNYAGIDIGSRTIELVVINDKEEIIDSLQTDTGFDPMANAGSLLSKVAFDAITATGYGRTLFEIEYEAETVTEIKAHAMGAVASFPSARAILDIGGQDSKVISLSPHGKVVKFEMNDRCAAGTGKFLEIMAKTLGYGINDFGKEALAAEQSVTISSMCTVFAESEVTSLIAKGGDCKEIALSLHKSVVRRVSSMLNRVAPEGDIVFTGGVANNLCMVSLLEQKLRRQILIPNTPQRTGALGAALLTRKKIIEA